MPRPKRPNPKSGRGDAVTPYMGTFDSVTHGTVQQRVAAMLAAYESGSIDADELHARLLMVEHVAAHRDRSLPQELAGTVSESLDLGHDEREEIAWAAAAYWRRTSEYI
jgi:hypothetical protein